MKSTSLTLDGGLPALLLRPPAARLILVLAHGAGSGMNHSFLAALAEDLAAHGVATLRYEFPYRARGEHPPDKPAVVHAAVRSAVQRAGEEGLPMLAGGKSFGGRMTSQAAALAPLAGVRGLVLVGFPLHAQGKPPSIARGEHLRDVHLPMLFLTGTRDELCDLSLLRPLLHELSPAPTLHVIDGADHSFHVLKRSGLTDAGVLKDLAGQIAQFGLSLP